MKGKGVEIKPFGHELFAEKLHAKEKDEKACVVIALKRFGLLLVCFESL